MQETLIHYTLVSHLGMVGFKEVVSLQCTLRASARVEFALQLSGSGGRGADIYFLRLEKLSGPNQVAK